VDVAYISMDQLSADTNFQSRVRACVVQQALTYVNDGRPFMVNCAYDCLRGQEQTLQAFYRLAGVNPGFAQSASPSGGTPDQTQVTDGALLAFVQGQFPTVAAMFYAPDGLTWSGAYTPPAPATT
jgi:hypothetical protein